MQNSTTTLLMQNGTPYQIQLCVEPGTQHSPEYLREHIVQAFDSLSTQTRQQRFASPINNLTDEQLDYLVNLDNTNRVAWCASIHIDDQEKGIGLARYVKLFDETDVAEFAITIVDEFQEQGIGYELIKKLLKTAAENHLTKLRGYILSGNKRMLSLCQHFDADIHTEDSSFMIAEIAVSAEPD